MELYLVKSSGQDEWGAEYWENLAIYDNLKSHVTHGLAAAAFLRRKYALPIIMAFFA